MAAEYDIPEVTAKIVAKKTLTYNPDYTTAAFKLDYKQKSKLV